MSLKLLLSSVLVGLTAVAGAYLIIAPRVSEPVVVTDENSTALQTEEIFEDEDEETEELDEAEDAEEALESTPAPIVKGGAAEPVSTPVPTPTSTPAPAPTSTPKPSGYTFAEVAEHADATSCWSVISGSVYDLTEWVSKHPGGKSKILGICGEDGTRSFENQHGDSSKVGSILSTYRIGALIP